MCRSALARDVAHERDQAQNENRCADDTRHDGVHRLDRHRILLVRCALADTEERPEHRFCDFERARLARLAIRFGHGPHPALPPLPSTGKNVYDMVTTFTSCGRVVSTTN